MQYYLLLLTGFILLIVSGRYLLKASVSIAYHFKLSKLVVGITVVAFGTSAPELFVTVIAAAKGHPEISIGNVVGSNIANIGLILGLTAILFPIPVNKKAIIADWPVMMFSTILFYLFIFNGVLSTAEGLLFLILLAGYLIYSVRSSIKSYKVSETESAQYHTLVALLLIVISSGGLAYGSYLLVNNASVIATNLGIGERVISITIIALGTSLPELTTSITAALRKEMDISVGNIIGSNIFNILCILGVASTIKQIEVPSLTISFDIFWVLGISLLMFIFTLPIQNSKISRIEGFLLLLVYSVYIYLLFKIV
jgi:cation:H+ antiporter